MSIVLNRQAAKLLELAAKSHRRAADFLELGDTKGCADYANEGFDRASFAIETSREATEESVQVHPGRVTNPGSLTHVNGG